MIMLSVIATVMITVPLAYQYSDAVDAAQGYVTSGSVSITEVAELTVNSTSGNYASLVKFNSTFYAMFYSDDGADGQVVHVTTNENMDQGASSIPDAFATTGEFYSADNQFNATDATHIDAVYNNATSALVAYQGTDADGFAAVVQITDNTVTTGNLLEFDVADASHIAIHRLN